MKEYNINQLLESTISAAATATATNTAHLSEKSAMSWIQIFLFFRMVSTVQLSAWVTLPEGKMPGEPPALNRSLGGP